MSFLGGLGAFAGGLDQTLAPLLHEQQENTATGQGIAAMYGGLPQQPQQQGGMLQGLLSGGQGSLQGLLSGGQSAPPMLTPQPGQGGVAQSPMPQPANIPTLPRGAPMNPSAGQTAPVGPQAAQAAPVQAPQPQPQQQPAQVSPQLQGQQNAPENHPALQPFQGQFDFNHLMSNLVKTPGMTYDKLGKIANSRAFQNMLNQQGLQQYRMLNLGLGAERVGVSEERLGQQAEEFRTREKRLTDRETNMTQQHALDRQEMQIEKAYSQSTQKLLFGPGDEKTKAAAQAEADKAYKEGLDRINKQRDDLDKQMSQSDKGESSSGGAEPDVMYDGQGNPHKYKGKGDRADPANWD